MIHSQQFQGKKKKKKRKKERNRMNAEAQMVTDWFDKWQNYAKHMLLVSSQ